MGKKIDEISIRNIFIKKFPKLVDDDLFEITSNQTPNYNCIAWACIYDDRWMMPHAKHPQPFDGIVYWPPEARNDDSLQALKDVFLLKGYVECENSEHEDGFLKVALYEKDNKWTHASRERRNGAWCSKMGPMHDIYHGSPYSLEGEDYGRIYCFMKRKFP